MTAWEAVTISVRNSWGGLAFSWASLPCCSHLSGPCPSRPAGCSPDCWRWESRAPSISPSCCTWRTFRASPISGNGISSMCCSTRRWRPWPLSGPPLRWSAPRRRPVARSAAEVRAGARPLGGPGHRPVFSDLRQSVPSAAVEPRSGKDHRPAFRQTTASHLLPTSAGCPSWVRSRDDFLVQITCPGHSCTRTVSS